MRESKAMQVETAVSRQADILKAVAEIKHQLASHSELVLFFASSSYASNELAQAMARAFPESQVVGCTTSGEIAQGEMLHNSVVAMGFPKEMVGPVAVAVVENLDRLQSSQVALALAELAEPFEIEAAAASPHQFAGLVLTDGLSRREEKLMEHLGDLSDVLFVGGSAGDDLHFKKTHVFADGKAYTNSAVLILMKPRCRFGVIKSQSFLATGKVLVATRVDEENRIVHEFDHRPAAQAYAEALGRPVEELSDAFMTHPLGLMSGAEPFVRSPMKVENDAVHFYCMIRQGMPLEILQSTDIVEDTRSSLQRKQEELGPLQAVINFHCILRTLELQKQGREKDYAELFNPWKNIGLSTYGEAYLGHINQTSTMLVLGDPS
ncbi:FIST C-terminal domain-containing protein [bacterium]|nr:FIST C-terminal domain-containing protein [bacterium]